MGGATVELWDVRLGSATGTTEFEATLSADERARAARFHFSRDRVRYVAGRSALRRILSGYLSERPADIRLGYGASGKPFLPDSPSLHFNLSHSGEIMLVAVSRVGPVGVDVEAVPEEPVVDEVARLVFSGPERRVLDATAGNDRCERFARFWTRKEAYIKADGRGMGMTLEWLDVATSAHRIFRCEHGLEWTPCPRWTVRSVPAPTGYAAAVVAEGPEWEILRRSWEPPSAATAPARPDLPTAPRSG